jgi:hypothetical protein
MASKIERASELLAQRKRPYAIKQMRYKNNAASRTSIQEMGARLQGNKPRFGAQDSKRRSGV